jgi:hypothetical protein
MSVSNVISFAVAAFFLIAPYAYAQESNDGSKSKKAVERVEVRGKKSRVYFYNQYTNYQEEFADSFNQFVDDRQMEVVCTVEKFSRSRIRKKNCKPRFITTIIARETQLEVARAIGGNIGDPLTLQRIANVTERPVVRVKTLKEYKKFQKLTVKLLNEHPELAATYIKMEDAFSQYKNFGKDDG